MSTNTLSTSKTPHELIDWYEDRALLAQIQTCVEIQKRAAETFMQTDFKPNFEAAADAVAEKTLQSILQTGQDVHGISSARHISNVIVFNNSKFPDAVLNAEVGTQRQSLDKMITKKIEKTLLRSKNEKIVCSGHFWYPPGSYMGWHTNSGAPGWRMYLSYADEPGKSFFRYRDPDSHEIITSRDSLWNVRLFEIRADKPLWHAIYSDTNRFSFGYMIYTESMRSSMVRGIKRLLKI